MSGQAEIGSSKLFAFKNIITLLDADAFLPGQVFSGSWSDFLFCESDRIFSRTFAPIVADLIHAEEAHSCCLLNFTQTYILEYQEAAMIFFDEATTGDEYISALTSGDASKKWLYRVDRYGCSSDKGEWCIYCERDNDLAVIGLRHSTGLSKFSNSLRKLGADTVNSLAEEGVSPFNLLTEEWHRDLTRYYGDGISKWD